MKKLVFAITLVVALIALSGGCSYAIEQKKRIQYFDYETTDNFIVKSTLTYPTVEKTKYPLVVLLHSLGYSSEYWGSLKSDFNQAGIAVLEIDLKGHGKSINDIYFKRRSWIYLTDKAFKLYPNEVNEIVKKVLAANKNISPFYVSYVGADIGANTAVITAQIQSPRPICLVLISPNINFRGLYIPIKLANAGNLSVLAIAAAKDLNSVKQLSEVEKFAQGRYEKKVYPNGGTGMIMLKLNPSMSVDIVNWVVDRMNEKS